MSTLDGKIQAIETQYAGCRFRSRLEARWAVFFDALDLEWHYEAQGYELASGVRYLPDFWLPSVGTLGLHVEVKGSEEALQADGNRYAEAVFTSAIPGHGLIFLGPIPDVGLDSPPPQHGALVRGKTCCGVPELNLAVFDWMETDLEDGMTGYTSVSWHPHEGEAPRLPRIFPVHKRSGYLDMGSYPWGWPFPYLLRNAYHEARKARFEHGQTPSRTGGVERKALLKLVQHFGAKTVGWPESARPNGGMAL